MTLAQPELIRRYPSQQVLRAMIQRNAPLPTDPVEHAIYADEIAFYKEAQARKAAANDAGAGMQAANAVPKANGGGEDPGSESAHEAALKPKRGGRVDLVAGDAAGGSMAGKKQAAMESGANGDDQAEMTVRGVNHGRQRHDETAFPEARTSAILELEPEARVLGILALAPADLVGFRRSLSQDELVAVTRDLTPQQKETLAALGGSARMVGAEVLQSRLERDVYSNRQMEAVMTDFWLNHFNVYLKKNQNEPYLLPAYERDAIRPHALGRFEDLLVATAKSPAMLVYLDNWQSIGPDSEAAHRGQRFGGGFAKNPQVKQALKERGLNENYARELMELHTVGVSCEVSKDHTVAELAPECGKGYTQADVTEVAKVFSGWTIDRPMEGGEYNFEERRHEPGKKIVLGQTIGEHGEREGLEVLHMLAMSPATAKFISTKLAVRFVSDTPPPALVDRMTKSYLGSGGEIRAVLRTMFDSPEFWATEADRGKVKTPLEFVTSALRATGAEVSNAVPVVQSLDRLGMPLYGMQTPNGYSWKSEGWVSTGALVTRMNFALVLSADKLPGTKVDRALFDPAQAQASVHSAALAEGGATDGSPVAEERRLEHILLGTPVSERTRAAVLAQAADGSLSQRAHRELLQGSDSVAGTCTGAGCDAGATRGDHGRTFAGLSGVPEAIG